METLGQTLRRNREAKGISVEAVVLHTRIQAVLIDAIEADRFDKIASLVSAKGFVRSYARFLNIDEAETIKRLSELSASETSLAHLIFPKAESIPGVRLAEEIPARMSSFPMGVDFKENSILDVGTFGAKIRTTPPYGWLAGISAVCLLGVLLLKLFIPSGNKKSEILVPTQTRLDAPALRNTPSPATPVISIHPIALADTAPEKKMPMVSSALNATLKPFILALEARESTWVKVLVDGKGTKDVLLRTGQKVVWEADKTFLLTMGNGGGAEVFLDGKELGFLGKKGEVVRDRLLTRVASEQAAIDDD
ncbi:MAG: DUF4115 domain-containing protein [Nitrospirae bacterium]|nr:DUF4115 domain-containing protein [Candidatus Troglogloeales bacterium]